MSYWYIYISLLSDSQRHTAIHRYLEDNIYIVILMYESMVKKIIRGYPVLNVKVSERTKERLDVVKIHPRQTYNEVIRILLDLYESKENQ